MSESDEKMGEVMDKNSTNSEDFLVLSIDQNGRIRYFNKECEKIVGYVKDEISDKQFFDYLIPDKYREQWEKLVDSVKQNKSTNEFVLPWLTKDGQEVMVSWNIAPVGDIDGTSGDIGLVGKLFKLEETGEDRSEFKRNEADNVEFSLGRKKFVFRKKHDSISDVASAKSKNDNSKKQQKSADKPIKIDKESKEESGSNEKEESSQVIKGEEEDIADDSPDLFEKYSPDNLAKKFRELDDTLRSLEELKEKNKELERENNNLRKALEEANKKSSKNGRDLSDERGLFGKLKKKKKLMRLMEELDEREKKLEELENQLNEDKKEINKRRNQFVNWREKLEQLEMEIETRREDLIKEEEIFKEKMLSSLDGNVREELCNLNELSSYSDNEFNEIKKENYDFLDRTSDSAAIVQRGILKKINEPFAKLLGYSEKDLIDRSLLDFVAPEGFSGIEDYYLDRLKGGGVTRYETVFLTKDDKALPVELVYRPSSFDDMKADLIIVNIRSEKDIKNG